MPQLLALVFLVITPGLLAACDGGDDADAKRQPRPEPAKETGKTGAAAETTKKPATSKPEPPAEPPPRLYARKYVSRVWSEPNLDSQQLGYMRAGAVVTAKSAETQGNDRCYRGWYEVAETGGFVCDGREVTAFEGEKLPDVQPTQPDRTAALPYEYAYTTRSGTPMYKRLPNHEEALYWEDGLLPDGGSVKAAEAAARQSDAGVDGGVDASTDEEDEGPKTLEELRNERGAFVRRILQAGFYVSLDRELERGRRKYWRTMSSGHVPANRLKKIEAGKFEGVMLAPGPHPIVPVASEAEAAETAAAASAQPDPAKSAKAAAAEQAPSKQGEGNHKDPSQPQQAAETEPGPPHDPPLHLPVAYIISSKTPRYERTDKGWLRKAKADPGYHHVFEIVGEEKARGRTYLRDPHGYLYRADQVRRIDRVDPPKELKDGARWLDINLSQQTLVAYEGETPVRATLISSGRVRGRPGSLRYHATPTGTFHILSKHVSATMDGDHAIDGPYSLEDVPYVQFFQGALALHSAFWHNRFGRASSHGCINLAPNDALWLFDWTKPDVPQQWHAAYPAGEAQGTLLRIRGETPPG